MGGGVAAARLAPSMESTLLPLKRMLRGGWRWHGRAARFPEKEQPLLISVDGAPHPPWRRQTVVGHPSPTAASDTSGGHGGRRKRPTCHRGGRQPCVVYAVWPRLPGGCFCPPPSNEP